jgi:hypothetical protein
MQVPFRLCKRGAAAKLMKRVRRGGREVFGIQNLHGSRTGLPEGEAAFRSVSQQRVSLHGSCFTGDPLDQRFFNVVWRRRKVSLRVHLSIAH